MSNTHNLKCLKRHFRDVEEGKKRAELRVNDRDFKVGDYVRLHETRYRYEGCKVIGPFYTGRTLTVVVTHVLTRETDEVNDAAYLGLEPGWVVFSFDKQW